MNYSRLFGKSLRTAPHDVKLPSYALLIRGGFLRSLGQGLFSFLPLGWRVVQRLEAIIREELAALGGQEVSVPFVNPHEIWRKSGRDDLIDREMVRFRDRLGREMVLAPTHEEAMVELARIGMSSYRDLPFFLFQFQSKFRDEERVRGGLVRAREFLMNDGYSFHRNFTDLNNFFPKVFSAYERIFKRCGVETISAPSGVGYMGGDKAYEFLMPNPAGDEVVIQCNRCGYRAKREIAQGIKECAAEGPATIERRSTPDCATIEALTAFLGLPPARVAKSMIFRLRSGFVMAVVRGDYEVSAEKLSRVVGEPVYRKATIEELEELGIVPGYLSPLQLDGRVKVVVDDAVANSSNLVYGGNEPGAHFINVNFGRDYEAESVADIASIRAENRCFQCGEPLSEIRAIELGNLFKLGDFYSRAMELTFQEESAPLLGARAFGPADEQRGTAVRRIYPFMGSYGIGMGRLLAAIVESNHDERGIRWPNELAPYQAYLMGVGKALSVPRVVEQIHRLAPERILCDDRNESPGVKFQDADLIGVPLRIVVSAKNLEQGKVEFRDRRTDATWLVDRERVAEAIERFAKGAGPDAL